MNQRQIVIMIGKVKIILVVLKVKKKSLTYVEFGPLYYITSNYVLYNLNTILTNVMYYIQIK